MLTPSKIIGCIVLSLITLTAQIASAASAADRAFLGITEQADPIGGIVSGLNAGNQIVLYNNGTDQLIIPYNGAFQFRNEIASGGAYQVTIAVLPHGQNCAVMNGQGFAYGPITNVQVVCESIHSGFTVGGTVVGLSPGSSGLSLEIIEINGHDYLDIYSSGFFTFPTVLPSGSYYLVTVRTQPQGEVCVINNGQGFGTDKNVTDVRVVCRSN